MIFPTLNLLIYYFLDAIWLPWIRSLNPYGISDTDPDPEEIQILMAMPHPDLHKENVKTDPQPWEVDKYK